MSEREKYISVIIPVSPGKCEVKFFKKIKEISYPLDRIEAIIVEGKNPSLQRNEGAKLAKGEIIYFLDDDSEPEKDVFERLERHYKTKEIVGVGGPSIPHPLESFWQRCFSSALSSSFGGFNIKARYTSHGEVREATEKDLILCNFSIRRDIFLKMGGFDEQLYPNEENEFFNRLVEKGYKLLYDPYLIVYRFSRKNIKEFARQIFRYGRGRMEHFFLSPKYFDPVYLVPLFFVCYILFLFLSFFVGNFNLLYFGPLFLYIILSLFFSVCIFIRKKLGIKGLFVMPIVFFVLHFSYGVGLIYGILKGISLRFKKTRKVFPIKVKRVENFYEKN